MALEEATDFAALVHKAWNGQFDLPTLFFHTNALEAQGQFVLAAVLYQTWITRNETPVNHFAYFNLGAALSQAGDVMGALKAYQRAIELAPHLLQARSNLGGVYEKLNRPDEALAEWNWVVNAASLDNTDHRPIRLTALNNRARLLEQLQRYGEALASLNASLETDPSQTDVLHHWVFLRAKQCIWPVYEMVPGVDPQLMRSSTSALAMIALSDDPQAQLDAARKYVREKVLTNVAPLSSPRAYGHQRLRIGYLSSDLCLHPIGLLTAELFELHDRQRFEVHGYCWTREDSSAVRGRIVRAIDHFVRIDALDDQAAAQRIRDDEIDIVIDLHGQTLGARANILAYRPAPIQITYLGLPATTGMPFIDYVIADRFLIPPELAGFYTEKPLYLPDVYQVSDRLRAVAAAPTRASCGLPAEAVVFCSFNNNFKFTPEMYSVWMNILRRVPGSVLWLLADNPWAKANLEREAAQRGIDPGRLVFATRVAPDAYLARYAVADLFLDSYPFNAGTTANDALWMGLPVLTCTGRTFASRMAGALLTAAGMPELITDNFTDYEDRAVALAGGHEERRQLRERLRGVKSHGALFDTPRFVRHLEEQLARLVAELGP